MKHYSSNRHLEVETVMRCSSSPQQKQILAMYGPLSLTKHAKSDPYMDSPVLGSFKSTFIIGNLLVFCCPICKKSCISGSLIRIWILFSANMGRIDYDGASLLKLLVSWICSMPLVPATLGDPESHYNSFFILLNLGLLHQ